jgi:vancomycin resistance protein YoaR
MLPSATDTSSPTAPRRARRPPPRRTVLRRRVFALGLVGVGLVAVVGAILARPYGQSLAPGTTIGGISVGGQTPAEAARTIAAKTAGTASRSIVVVVEGTRLRIRLRAIGERPDPASAIDRARRSTSALDRLAGRLGLGGGRRLALPYRFDPKKLERVLTPLRNRYEKKMQPATVVVSATGGVSVKGGVAGLQIDRPTLARALTDPLSVHQPLTLSVRRVDPSATASGATAAATRARALLAGHYSLELAGTTYPLPAAILRRSLLFVPSAGVVRLRVSRPAIDRYLTTLFGRAAAAPVDASFDVDGAGKVEVVPSQSGRVVDADAVASSLESHPERSVIPVSIAMREAPFSTKDAQALGITDLVGSFTTPFEPGLPRVTNIQRAASVVNGTIVMAHGTFSLNKVLGQRTVEKGYVTAPEIAEGELKDSVGGGVSQIATTLYNAAFFSGLQLVAHTPHQFWISRYPKGREATVSWGGPELVFRNQWEAPLVVLVSTTQTSVTVRMFSRLLGRRVTTATGEPTAIKEAKEREILNPKLAVGERNLVQAGGTEGFHVTYWRRVFVGTRQLSYETFAWTYIPEDTIYEVGPAPAPPPTTSTSTSTGTGEGTTPTDTGPGSGSTTGEAPATTAKTPTATGPAGSTTR